MIQFENATNLEDFKKAITAGKYHIEKDRHYLKIYHNLYAEPYIYGLQKVGENHYCFWSKNDEYFSVDFLSEGNKIEILYGEKSGQKM